MQRSRDDPDAIKQLGSIVEVEARRVAEEAQIEAVTQYLLTLDSGGS